MFHWTLQKKVEAAERFETWGGGWRGAYLSLSRAHTCTEIFQNTLGNLHSVQSVCTDREGIIEREDGERGWGGRLFEERLLLFDEIW